MTFTPSNLPQAIDLSLINALSSYLKYPPIGSTLAASALPPALQSPLPRGTVGPGPGGPCGPGWRAGFASLPGQPAW